MDEKSKATQIFVDYNESRFLAFAKIRIFAQYVQEQFLENLGNYKTTKQYSQEVFSLGHKPIITDDEMLRMKSGELLYQVTTIQVKRKLTKEQEQQGYKDTEPKTQITKSHLNYAKFRFRLHMDEEYVLMARAIVFYLSLIAKNGNFVFSSEEIFHIYKKYEKEWPDHSSQDYRKLTEFNWSLENDFATSDVSSDKSINLLKKLYLSEDVTEPMLEAMRMDFDITTSEDELLRYKELSRHVVEVMVKIILLQNNITPKIDCVVASEIDTDVPCYILQKLGYKRGKFNSFSFPDPEIFRRFYEDFSSKGVRGISSGKLSPPGSNFYQGYVGQSQERYVNEIFSVNFIEYIGHDAGNVQNSENNSTLKTIQPIRVLDVCSLDKKTDQMDIDEFSMVSRQISDQKANVLHKEPFSKYEVTIFLLQLTQFIMDNAERCESDLTSIREFYSLKSSSFASSIGSSIKIDQISLFKPLKIPTKSIDEKFNAEYQFIWKKCSFFDKKYEDSVAPRSCSLHLASFFLKLLPEENQEKPKENTSKTFNLKEADKKAIEEKKKEKAYRQKLKSHHYSKLQVYDLRFKSSVYVRSHEDTIRMVREKKRLEFEAEKRDSHSRKIITFKPQLKDVISILKRIPSFNLKFSDQQIQMLTDNAQVLITIGRSGTGKTTCSILRMIAIDLLYIASIKQSSADKKIYKEDISATGIRQVFITANEVLSKELKQLHTKIMAALRNKFSSKNSGSEPDNSLDTAINIAHDITKLNEKIDEVEMKFDSDGQGADLADAIKSLNLIELEKLVKDINFGSENYTIPDSMKYLEDADFPLFCTLRELFTMLNNATCHEGSDFKPFFKSDQFKAESIKSQEDAMKLKLKGQKLNRAQRRAEERKIKEFLKLKEAERANFKQDGVNKSFLMFLDHYSTSRFRQEQDKDKAFMSADESKKMKHQEENIYLSKLITLDDFEDFYKNKLSADIRGAVPMVLLYSSLINNSLLDLKTHVGDSISKFNFEEYQNFKKEKKLYDFHDLFKDTEINIQSFELSEVQRFNKAFGMKFSHPKKEDEDFSSFRTELLILDCASQLKLLKKKYPNELLQKEEVYISSRDQLLLKIDDLKKGKQQRFEKSFARLDDIDEKDFELIHSSSELSAGQVLSYTTNDFEDMVAKGYYYDADIDLIKPFNRYGAENWHLMIDYLYVDEIQDIHYDVLLSLCRLTRRNVMLFGDNAQNIAKGISLKFNYLAQHLRENFFNVSYLQLTKNFRSHQNILDMGNFLVKILTVIARGDLEIMPDESSERTGPKPLVFNPGMDHEQLKEGLVQSLDASIVSKDDPSLKFKNEFVVLVRDSETKKSLPDFLKNAVCMTIMESKGLEFEDVLIYDFFDTTKAFAAWNMLNNIELHTKRVSEYEYQKLVALQKMGQVDNNNVFVTASRSEEMPDHYNVTFAMLANEQGRKNAVTYGEINDELKQFYVAVTRTKNRLIIFDNSTKHNSAGHPIRRLITFWKALQYAEVISEVPKKQVFEACLEKQDSAQNFEEWSKTIDPVLLAMLKMRNYSSGLTEEQFRANWIKKAVDFLNQNKLEFSKLCFNAIGHKEGQEFVTACQTIQQIQRKKEYLLNRYADLSEIELEQQENLIEKDFRFAAEIFEKQNRHSLVAKCYISLGEFEKAREQATKSNDLELQANVYYLNKDFSKAYECYCKIGDKQMKVRSLLGVCEEDTSRYEELLEEMVELTNNMNEVQYDNFKPFLENVLRSYFSYLNLELNDQIAQKDTLQQLVENSVTGSEQALTEFQDLDEEAGDNDDDEDEYNVIEENRTDVKNSFVDLGKSDGGTDDGFIALGSRQHSFELIKSDLDSVSKMNESFVDAAQLVKSDPESENHSIFEEIRPVVNPGSLDFMQMRTISKLIKYTSCFFDKLNGYMTKKAYKVGLEIEDDIDSEYLSEDPKVIEILLEILAQLGLTNLLYLVFAKFNIKYPIERSLIANVRDYSTVFNTVHNFSVTSTFDFKRLQTNLNQRKISSMVISEIFKKLSVGAIRTDVGLNCLAALGFIRQIPALTSKQTALELLGLLGSPEFAVPLYGYLIYDKGMDLDKFLIKANSSSSIQKLSLVFDHSNFRVLSESQNTVSKLAVIDSLLFKLASYEIWECTQNTELREKKFNDCKDLRSNSSLLADIVEFVERVSQFKLLEYKNDQPSKMHLAKLFRQSLHSINKVLIKLQKSQLAKSSSEDYKVQLLIAGFSSAILVRYIVYNSYILNTPDSIDLMKEFFTMYRKSFILSCLELEPSLYTELVTFFNLIKEFEYSSVIDSKNRKLHRIDYTNEQMTFIKGFSTAYLVRIIDTDIRELSFFTTRRTLVNRFSCILSQNDLQVKDPSLYKELDILADNGGEFYSRSLHSVMGNILNPQLFSSLEERILAWGKLPSVVSNFASFNGKSALVPEAIFSDQNFYTLQGFVQKIVNLRYEIGNLSQDKHDNQQYIEVYNSFENHKDNTDSRKSKVNKGLLEKLKNMDEGVYFQTHAQTNTIPAKFEWIPAIYDDFRRSVDTCSNSPYFYNQHTIREETHTKSRTSTVEGCLRAMRIISKLETSLNVNFVYDYFSLCLKLGDLSYFHKFKSLVIKKFKSLKHKKESGQIQKANGTELDDLFLNRNHSSEARDTHTFGKKLSHDIFNLMDSEISLLTGNTEEFYNESLKFLDDNLDELEFQKACELFYKILQVVVVENATYKKSSTNGKALLFKEDYLTNLGSSYLNFGSSNLQLNRIEADDGYTYLESVYDKLKTIYDSHYYPDCFSIFRKIKILIVSNKVFSLGSKKKDTNDYEHDYQSSEDEEHFDENYADEIKELLDKDQVVEVLMTLSKSYSLDSNYEKYESLVNSIVKARYRTEYASRVFYTNKSRFQKFIATRRNPTQEKGTLFEGRVYAKSIDAVQYLGLYSKNPQSVLTLLSNKNLRNYFEDEVMTFMNSLLEKFYITKELVLEELLPFMIEYNTTMKDLVQSVSDYPIDQLNEEFLLKIYTTHLLKQHQFSQEISEESNQIKFFTKENQFFKSQEDLLKKMLSGFKVSKDLQRVKQTAARQKELLQLLRDMKNTKKQL